MENKEKVRKIMKHQGKVMENDEKVRKILKNQRKILENEEKVRKNEGNPMKNEGKVMENKEKVRKPCPRQKKKSKTRKKIQKNSAPNSQPHETSNWYWMSIQERRKDVIKILTPMELQIDLDCSQRQ